MRKVDKIVKVRRIQNQINDIKDLMVEYDNDKRVIVILERAIGKREKAIKYLNSLKEKNPGWDEIRDKFGFCYYRYYDSGSRHFLKKIKSKKP